MMTSSNGNLFRVTGHLCGEFTSHRWIPPPKGQWCGALMLSLICAWINRWVKNGEAGDLRRYHAHYDVIVMIVRNSDSFLENNIIFNSSYKSAIPSYHDCCSCPGAKYMMTSSNGNIFGVTGPLWGESTSEFLSQRPVMRSFGVFFDLCRKKLLNKQSRLRWFETPSRS